MLAALSASASAGDGAQAAGPSAVDRPAPAWPNCPGICPGICPGTCPSASARPWACARARPRSPGSDRLPPRAPGSAPAARPLSTGRGPAAGTGSPSAVVPAARNPAAVDPAAESASGPGGERGVVEPAIPSLAAPAASWATTVLVGSVVAVTSCKGAGESTGECAGKGAIQSGEATEPPADPAEGLPRPAPISPAPTQPLSPARRRAAAAGAAVSAASAPDGE